MLIEVGKGIERCWGEDVVVVGLAVQGGVQGAIYLGLWCNMIQSRYRGDGKNTRKVTEKVR